ncbi:MAG: cobalt ECF transporter T component CbiQ [Thermodesulfobacteriota bacterium]
MIEEEIFSRGDSLLHRLDPRIKVVAAFSLTVVIALSQTFPAAFMALFIASCLLVAGRLKFSAVLKRVLAVNTFIAVLWFTLPLTYNGEAIWHWGSLEISLQGVKLAALLTVKANSLIIILITLLATSKTAEIGHSLRLLGVPEKLCFLLLVSYRYIFVINREYQRLRRAARLRSFTPRTNLHTYRTYGYLFGMTLVRSWNRARRVNQAMLLRGFQGKFFSGLSRDIPWPDFVFLAIFILFTCLIVFLNLLYPGIS